MAEKNIKIPINQRELINLLQVSDRVKGQIIPTMQSVFVLVIAGNTVNYTIDIPNGFNYIINKEHEIKTNFYDTRITVDFSIDNKPEKIDVQGLAMTTAQDIQESFFIPIKNSLNYTFVNGTTTDTEFYIQLQYISINVGFFENFYSILINNNFDELKNLVDNVKRGEGLINP